MIPSKVDGTVFDQREKSGEGGLSSSAEQVADNFSPNTPVLDRELCIFCQRTKCQAQKRLFQTRSPSAATLKLMVQIFKSRSLLETRSFGI